MKGKLFDLLSDVKCAFRINYNPKENVNSSPLTPLPAQPTTDLSLQFALEDSSGAGRELEEQYESFGKLLGAGSGGSVWTWKRRVDGRMVAIKRFRNCKSDESKKDHFRKVATEFRIGSSFHHCNVIQVVELIKGQRHWFQVMEYAPYDLFAAVKTRKMSPKEVNCTFRQIIAGASYLHDMGFAHRDLKLENVVVNEHGIMKIIDFGCATAFRSLSGNLTILAQGKKSTRDPLR